MSTPRLPDTGRQQPRALILVVDDETMLRELIAQALDEFQVSTAGDGCEAVSLLQEKDFDLIITDLMMPRGDGFSVLRAVRDLKRTSDVIVLTGFASAENEKMCRDLGCTDIMSKPFEVAQLRAQVDRCLQGHQRV